MSGVGLKMIPLPGASTQPYYGSPASTPVHAAVGPVLDRMRREMPEQHRLLTLGVGVTDLLVDEADLVLRPRRWLDLRMSHGEDVVGSNRRLAS